MRFALGMDNREIARALGRSDGATKVLIHRAIRQLEELVGDRDATRGSQGESSDGQRGAGGPDASAAANTPGSGSDE
jgi:hypothetical protein